MGDAMRIDNYIRQSPNACPLLTGGVISIKDNFSVQDTRTTAGSIVLENYVSPYDATVIEKLRINKALILGKNNMDEFGMGSSGLNSAYKAAINSWSTSHQHALSAGGSSGASAAAVAAFLCHGAIGSDTGGSIRQPASFTGISFLRYLIDIFRIIKSLSRTHISFSLCKERWDSNQRMEICQDMD